MSKVNDNLPVLIIDNAVVNVDIELKTYVDNNNKNTIREDCAQSTYNK